MTPEPVHEQIDWTQEANGLLHQLITWRRDFHMYPEIGFQETRTAGIVANELIRLGYQVQTGIAKTGVIAWLDSGIPGPVVMIRFDMDALALCEENDIPYRSRIDGMMHGCGHDAHVAIGLGVATLFAQHRHSLKGTIKLMFQPAEEGLNGAEFMVKEGALDQIGPATDIALAAHVWNEFPLGEVGITPGPIMAQSDFWEGKISGLGGHGACPHLAMDPTIATAQIMLAFQTIVSRNVDPQRTAVISVGTLRAGDMCNIIPESVTITGTVRFFEPEVRKLVLERMETVIHSISSAHGCSATLQVTPVTPVLINDPKITEAVRSVAARMVGESKIVEHRTMGSEDMAFVNNQVPGCYLFIGSRDTNAKAYDHHNPRFNIDENVLPLATALLCAAASDLLGT